MENTLFAYFENRIFPAPATPQQKDSLQLFLDDCGIPENADSPFTAALFSADLTPSRRRTANAISATMPNCTRCVLSPKIFLLLDKLPKKTAVFYAVCFRLWSRQGWGDIYHRFCGSCGSFFSALVAEI